MILITFWWILAQAVRRNLQIRAANITATHAKNATSLVIGWHYRERERRITLTNFIKAPTYTCERQVKKKKKNETRPNLFVRLVVLNCDIFSSNFFWNQYVVDFLWNFFFQYRKKNEMRRFLRRNEMRAAYWKQTCFFF